LRVLFSACRSIVPARWS